MAAKARRVDRLRDEVDLLATRGLPRDAYFAELGARLRDAVDCDAACWHTIDPLSKLITSDAPHELIDNGIFTPASAPAAGAGIVASEYLREDFNTFASLSGRRVTVGTLTGSTRGRPKLSSRYRDVLEPAGIPIEMRAAFVSRGRCWGAVHLARREGREDFTSEDVEALASVSSAIAEGIRTSLRFDAARRPDEATSPGLVVLGAANEIELITPPARDLLEALRSPALTEDEATPPTAVIALAGFTRTRAPERQPHTDVIAIPSRIGWITLHSSLPQGSAAGQVAIVIERAATPQTTALRLETHGVTAREREIALLLAQGLTNAEIATALVLSPYTVQDHIKALFEKTSVASRQELVARMFLDDYMPQIARQAPLTSQGGFAASA